MTETTVAETDTTVLTPAEEEDWVAIMQALVNLRDELYATSDPSRAGEFCAPGAFCYEQLVAQLTDAQSKGWHVVDQGPITIVTGQFENRSDNSGLEIVSVLTDVLRSEQHGRIVDADGNTVFELVPEDPGAPREARIQWTLVRLDGAWRVLDQVTI